MNGTALPNTVSASGLFGYVLRQQRTNAAVTVEDLARLASLDVNRLREIDGGFSEPDLLEVFSIAEALGQKPSQLIRQFEELSNS